jgi:hypothetical protein
MHKVKALALAALVFCAVSGAVSAQTPRTASYSGSTWGFYLLPTGAGMNTMMTGSPSLYEGHPEAIITIVSRDGRALTEADRNLAISLARGLCEQSGRHFNTQTRGHWLTAGGLGFQGACTEW